MASHEEIEQLIEATDIVSLVEGYGIKLTKQGKNYKGLCPFHSEKTSSFVVSPEKKLAHCFGCSGGGDPIKFVMQIENVDFNRALEILASKVGFKLSSTSKTNKPNPLTKYYNIMQTSQAFYKKYLENTKDGLEALEYLHKRGLDDETIELFGIGLAPKNSNSLYQVLKESNYLELDMADVGLIDKSEKGYYDLFTKRIMFPVYNEDGNVVAYSGRIFNNPDKSQPKYVNSRETIIFKKREALFNIWHAKGEILKKKRVILHEGQMDVIASFRSGLKEAVCSMGTALTLEQAKILKKYTDHVIICYDGDSAGVHASMKAIKIFESLNFKIHLVLLPNGMDPDEFVLKNGPEAYVKYFEENMIDSLAYSFEQAILNKNLSDDNVKKEVQREVFDLLLSKNSLTDEEVYLDKLANALGVSYNALALEYNALKKSNYNRNNQNVNNEFYLEYNHYNEYQPYESEIVPSVVISPKENKYEARLFIYARSSKEKALYIDKMLNDRMDGLSQANQLLWIKLINDYYEQNNIFSEQSFVQSLSDEDYKQYLRIVEAVEGDATPYTDEDLNDCLEKMKSVKFSKRNEKITEDIIKESNDDKIKSLLAEKFKNKRQQNDLKIKRRK